jgi:hypothetical protein
MLLLFFSTSRLLVLFLSSSHLLLLLLLLLPLLLLLLLLSIRPRLSTLQQLFKPCLLGLCVSGDLFRGSATPPSASIATACV